MRTALKFVLLLMLTASLTSCEKIKNWFNVEIDTTIEGQLVMVSDVAELKSTEDHSINGSATIDLADNEDLADYQNLIEDIEVSDVYLIVNGVDSSDVVIRAGSMFSIATVPPSDLYLDWPINVDFSIMQGTRVDLEADDYSVLNAMLLGDETVVLTATGSCNKGNVTITLNYGIEVLVEANPID